MMTVQDIEMMATPGTNIIISYNGNETILHRNNYIELDAYALYMIESISIKDNSIKLVIATQPIKK